MNATEAIKLLEPIPKDQFMVGDFTDQKSKCCAIGHLIRLTSNNPNDYSRNNCEDIVWFSEDHSEEKNKVRKFAREEVKRFLQKTLEEEEFWEQELAAVNNQNNVNGYTEDNPKDRVIHLLKDMQAVGY